MPEDLRGVWRGTPIQAAPPDLLEAAHDGGKGRGLLQDVFPGSMRGDAGIYALPLHI